MRQAPCRLLEQSGRAPRGGAPTARAPEHVVLRLQRSAGNAAVAHLMRNGGVTTAETRSRSTVSFLNSYTPLMRGLRQKVDAGEQLDRVDLDTLRELRAEASGYGLRNLVTDCDELIERASGRGIIVAPEEVAPPEPAAPARPAIDLEAVSAAIAAATTAVIKDQVQKSGHLDNSRGGRHHGTVGGVDYTLYDIDDVLFTRQAADAIEALMRRVEVERGELLDTKGLWQTVVALGRQGTPIPDILALLEIYAAPPTHFEFFQHFWREAMQALPAQRTREALADDSQPSRLAPPSPEQLHGPTAPMKALLKQYAQATGLPYQRPMITLERLKRETDKLVKLRQEYNARPGAQHAHAEFGEFDTALAALRGLRKTITTLIKQQEWATVLQFDDERILGGLEAGYRAAAKVRVTADAGAAAASEAEQVTKHVKKDAGPSTATATARKGGTDGVWDYGFDAGELATWIDKSSKRSMNAKNVSDCAQYISVHKTGGSSGGTGTKLGGQMVYHISHGKKDSTDGCTVFFTHAGDGTITIVGVGSHSGEATVAYKLDWKNLAWVEGGWNKAGTILTLKK